MVKIMNSEHVHDLLPEYVLGTLEASDATRVAQHLAGCDECRAQADEYRKIVVQMPQAMALASGLRPPPAVKQRLLDSITRPPSPAPHPITAQINRLSLEMVRRVASVAVLALLLLSGVWIAQLNVALAREQELRISLMTQTELIFEVVDADNVVRYFMSPVSYVDSPFTRPPYGKVFIRPDMPYVVAMGGRLPPAPEGQVYRLWLYQGAQALLAGEMTVDADGFASLIYHAEVDGPMYDAAQVVLQAPSATTPDGVLLVAWERQ
jgi:Anti-sigma-K factor rskA/Putative zinc-finger